MEAVLKAAAESGTALEINANPARLDLDDLYARRALELGCLLAINTDAHSADNFELAHFGVGIARRSWATAENVINAWPVEKLLHWLDERGHRRVRKPAPLVLETPAALPAVPVKTEAPPKPSAPKPPAKRKPAPAKASTAKKASPSKGKRRDDASARKSKTRKPR
jgi:hypothetical protein